MELIYMKKNIRPKLYALSTCVHCHATKRFLKEHNIDYNLAKKKGFKSHKDYINYRRNHTKGKNQIIRT